MKQWEKENVKQKIKSPQKKPVEKKPKHKFQKKLQKKPIEDKESKDDKAFNLKKKRWENEPGV